MGYRYCPECGRWLETFEYTVGEGGETICPDHKAVHGFIIDGPWTEQEFRREHPSWYDDREEMLSAARQQGLVK
jgi:hypothetical protein